MVNDSPSSAAWLSSVVNWTSTYLFDAETDPDSELNEDEVVSTFRKLEALYQQAKAGIGGVGKVGIHYNVCVDLLTPIQRRTVVMSPSNMDSQASKGGSADPALDTFDDRIMMLQSLVDKKISTALELLVTISGLLQPNDYIHIAPMLWYQHLDDSASHIIAPVRQRLLRELSVSN